MSSLKTYLEAWKSIAIESQLEQWAKTVQDAMFATKARGGRIFICGNGGSAANAIHIANDFTYGYLDETRRFDIEALPANSAVLTCLANDIGYDKIFSHQLENKVKSGDLLIVLSGSGNSPNILKAIEAAQSRGGVVLGMLGYQGGKAKEIVDILIHTDVDDMQVAEDLQLIIAHAAMRMMADYVQTVPHAAVS